jgi:hypothetical protein
VSFDRVDLKKYRRYEVVMTAYNIIGESPASGPVEVFVGEAGKLQVSPHPSAGQGSSDQDSQGLSGQHLRCTGLSSLPAPVAGG